MARKLSKDSPGAAMNRMAELNAKLTEISRNERLTFEQREAKAAPLRKEMAELQMRLWGANRSA